MEIRTHLPPAGHHLPLALYDPFSALAGAGRARDELVEQAALRPGHRVLDVGCGTGTLALRIRRLHPQVEVVGIDPDEEALALARGKVRGEPIQLDRGFSDALPYPDASFDRVFSSFMLHHVAVPEKPAMLREVRRVLRPGGSLHLVDFGGPGRNGLLSRLLHGRERDQLGEGVLTLLRDAGLDPVALVQHRSGWMGPMAWYRAQRP